MFGKIDDFETLLNTSSISLTALEISILTACKKQEREINNSNSFTIYKLNFPEKETALEDDLREAFETLVEYNLIKSFSSDNADYFPYILKITHMGKMLLRELSNSESINERTNENDKVPVINNTTYNINNSVATVGNNNSVNITNNISESFNHLKSLLKEDDMVLFEEMKAEASTENPSIDSILGKAKRFVTKNKDVIMAITQIVSNIISKILG